MHLRGSASVCALLLLPGCLVTSSEFQGGKREVVERINGAEDSLGRQHEAQLGGDVQGLKQVVAEGRKVAEDALAKARVSEEEAKKYEEKLLHLKDALVGVVGDLTGPVGGRVLEAIQGHFTRAREESRKEAETVAKETVAPVKEEAASTAKVVANLGPRLDKLETDTLSKIAGFTTETKAELALLAKTNNEAEFRSRFAEEARRAGVGPAEMQRLKGLSMGELLELLGIVLGVSAGGGTLASRLGKSRSKPELDRARKEIDELYDKYESLLAARGSEPAGPRPPMPPRQG